MGKVYYLFRFTEDEFGNRKIKPTKAGARYRLRRNVKLLRQAENQLVDSLTRRARDEICAFEDARVFREMTWAAFHGLGLRVIQGGR